MSSYLTASRSFSLSDAPIGFNPSVGARDVDLSAISKRIATLRTLTSGAAAKIADVVDSQSTAHTLAEQLLAKSVALKALSASVAMYFSSDWRTKLFSRLDVLLDLDNWQDGDQLPSEQSFSTLLRMMIYLHPTRRPIIGLSPSGHFVTAWRRDEDRLVIECIGNDDVRWLITKNNEGAEESGAGKVSLHRIPDVTAPYEPESLYTDGQQIII